MIKWERLLFAAAGALAFASCSNQGGTGPVVPGGSQPQSGPVAQFSRESGVQALCGAPQPGHAGCFALVRTGVRYATPPQYRAVTGIAPSDLASAAAKGYFGPLGPPQLQQAYGLPSATAGAGQTVGIVDAYDDPTAESDLAAYRSAFKLPACTTANGCFKKINERGKASPLPSPNPGWAGEISLDVDMVSAICPKCHIVLVEADTNSFVNLGTAVGAAHKAGANQISNSYGGPECVIGKITRKVKCYSPMPIAKYYNIPHTIITASSGDSDWFAGPQAPADFGTVIAVGGTSIYPYNNSRGWLETAWTGGGSSCSRFVKRPAWIPANTGCKKGLRRPIADVSSDADPYTGVLVYQTYPYSKGGFGVYGGTSVASPTVASIYALAGNARSQNYGATLYKSPANALTDVTVGSNGIVGYRNDAGQPCDPIRICKAMPGWDGPTGNGTAMGVGAF